MLVCNVSLRAPRGAIAATLAEAGAATDAATAAVDLTALADNPAFAAEIVDAFVGEIMLEAASAADVVDVAGATLAVSLDEATTADAAQDATLLGAAVSRSAMLPGVFVNSDTSREAYVDGVMVNQ